MKKNRNFDDGWTIGVGVWILSIIAWCMFFALCASGQVPPPPAASQAEVNAGVLTSKYVSPATLAGMGTIGRSTNYITNPNQIVIYTNAASLVGATPLPAGLVGAGGLSVYAYLYTNSTAGYAVYTGPSQSTAGPVLVWAQLNGNFNSTGWNLVKSNELASPSSYDFQPSVSSASLSGNWSDQAGLLTGTFLATNTLMPVVTVSANNLPTHAIIYTDNYFYYQGGLLGPFADQSTTINTALSLFPVVDFPTQANGFTPGGGVLEFVSYNHDYTVPTGGSFHKISQPIIWPPAGHFGGSTLTIIGPGTTAGALWMTNLQPTVMMMIGTTGTNNPTVFNMYDMCLAQITNALGLSMVQLGNTIAGGIARADIERNMFTCWPAMTNSWRYWGGNFPFLTPDVGAGFQITNAPATPGLISINLTNALGDKVIIANNAFQYIAGNWLQNDHGVLTYNAFESCGGNNSFPNSSPFSDYTVNVFANGGGHNEWSIGYNDYVGQAGYTFLNMSNQVINGDDYETFAGWFNTNGLPIVVSDQNSHITVNNPMATDPFPLITSMYDVTSAANYSNLQPDTNWITVVSDNVYSLPQRNDYHYLTNDLSAGSHCLWNSNNPTAFASPASALLFDVLVNGASTTVKVLP